MAAIEKQKATKNQSQSAIQFLSSTIHQDGWSSFPPFILLSLLARPAVVHFPIDQIEMWFLFDRKKKKEENLQDNMRRENNNNNNNQLF